MSYDIRVIQSTFLRYSDHLGAQAGLPDVFFVKQKSKFLYSFEGFGIENFVKFDGHLVYLMAIWYILRLFGIFYGHLVYFMAIMYINGHLVYLIAIWYIFEFLWYI
jgi:hypothetical protein